MERYLINYFDSLRGNLPRSGLHSRIIDEVEKPLITITLRATKGNQLKASDLLGLNENTLEKKLETSILISCEEEMFERSKKSCPLVIMITSSTQLRSFNDLVRYLKVWSRKHGIGRKLAVFFLFLRLLDQV